jgi:hypothetical protein
MRMYGIGTAAVLSVTVPVLLSIHARGITRPYQRHMRMHRNTMIHVERAHNPQPCAESAAQSVTPI